MKQDPASSAVTKVCYLCRSLFRHEYVPRLQISVDDFQAMKVHLKMSTVDDEPALNTL